MRSATLRLAAIAAFATAACSSSTDAPPVPLVRLTIIDVNGPIVDTDPNGQPRVSCELELRAVGAGGGSATWLEAMLQTLTVSGDPATRQQTTNISADVVRATWQRSEIGAGEIQRSRWIAWRDAPFSGTLQFIYRATAGDRANVSTVAFNCR